MTPTPPPEGRPLADRVRDLEARFTVLEVDVRFLRRRSPGDAPRETGAAPIGTPVAIAPMTAPPATLPVSAEPAAAEQIPGLLRPPPRADTRLPGRSENRASLRDAFEQRIGGKLFAIAGALVVVIGLALFMKLAVDQGWLGLMPPVMRCVFGTVFGLVLVLTGELARRRINAWAATGLLAAGIGAVYLSAYAAYAFFSLLSPGAAFVLLALAAALGVGAAIRANLAAVAIISLVGGYLAPLLVAVANPSPLVLPIYLLVLLAGGLALAAWKRGHFRLVAGVVWTGTLLLGTPWLLFQGRTAPEIALVFLAVAWSLMHAGHALSLWAPALPEPAYDNEAPRPPLRISPAAALAVGASVSASTWAVGLAAWLLDRTNLLPEWVAPAAAIAPCIVLGQVLAGGLRVLKDKPRTDGESFGAVLLVQAAGLLIAAIALGVSGTAAVVVWLALGLASIVAGNWVGARGLRMYGVVLLAIGAARLVAYDLFFTATATPLATRWGIDFSWWMLLAASAGAAWLGAAELLRRARPPADGADPATRPLAAPVCAALVGVLLLTMSPMNDGTEAAALMFIWMALALVLSLGLWRVVRTGLETLAMIPAAASLAAWVAAFVAPGGMGLAAPMPALGLHSGTWAAAALLAGVWLIARRSPGMVRVAGLWVISLAGLYASTLEVVRLAELSLSEPRAALAAVSIWWGVLGIAAVAVGFARRAAPVRYAALGLMILAAGKVLVIDLAGAPPTARIASLVGTGLLMLAVSVIYARVAKTLAHEDHPPG